MHGPCRLEDLAQALHEVANECKSLFLHACELSFEFGLCHKRIAIPRYHLLLIGLLDEVSRMFSDFDQS